jgi:hypothetical protein
MIKPVSLINFALYLCLKFAFFLNPGQLPSKVKSQTAGAHTPFLMDFIMLHNAKRSDFFHYGHNVFKFKNI